GAERSPGQRVGEPVDRVGEAVADGVDDIAGGVGDRPGGVADEVGRRVPGVRRRGGDRVPVVVDHLADVGQGRASGDDRPGRCDRAADHGADAGRGQRTPAIIRPPPRAPAPPVIALKVSPLWMPSIICLPPKKTSATGRALPRNGAALPRNGAASPTHFAASSAHPKNLVFPIPVGMPMALATSSASPLNSEPTLKMFLWIALSYIQDPATNSKRSSALPRNRVKSRTSPVRSRIFLPLFHRPWNAFQTLPPS